MTHTDASSLKLAKSPKREYPGGVPTARLRTVTFDSRRPDSLPSPRKSAAASLALSCRRCALNDVRRGQAAIRASSCSYVSRLAFEGIFSTSRRGERRQSRTTASTVVSHTYPPAVTTSFRKAPFALRPSACNSERTTWEDLQPRHMFSSLHSFSSARQAFQAAQTLGSFSRSCGDTDDRMRAQQFVGIPCVSCVGRTAPSASARRRNTAARANKLAADSSSLRAEARSAPGVASSALRSQDIAVARQHPARVSRR